MTWETFEHIALIAIVINTTLQTLDILVYKTLIHREYRTKHENHQLDKRHGHTRSILH